MPDSRDPYTDPETGILRNKPGIKTAANLDAFERLSVQQRMREKLPTGRFDLAHLKAIHRHLFQDVYDWAGEIRTVEISKGGHQFQFRQFVSQGVDYVHKEIAKTNFLRGLSPEEFAERAATVIGDLNYAHPFREGNGRTQFVFLAQLAERAGHAVNVNKVPNQEWISASKQAFQGDTSMMAQLIGKMISIAPGREVAVDPGHVSRGENSLLDQIKAELRSPTVQNAPSQRPKKCDGLDPTD